MPTFRAELRSSRRLLRWENVVIFDPRNDGEVAKTFADMARRAGVKPAGHKLRLIDTSGRRWRTEREVAG